MTARDDGAVLSPKLSADMRRAMSVEHFAPGEVLLRQGDATTRLFLIVSGKVRVLLGIGGQARAVAQLSRGAWVGETALLTGGVSSTTVVAETEVRALAVARTDFLAVAERDPAIFRELARELAERLRGADAMITAPPPARVAALLHGVSHARHAAAVVAECAHWSQTPFIVLDDAEPAAGARPLDGAFDDASSVAALRSRLDAGAQVTLGVGGANPDDLARFLGTATEFAPLIVLTGARVPAGARDQTTEEYWLHPAPSPYDAPPAGVDVRQVAVSRRFDAAAVARQICRQRIGLALGGGGARGFAHIGVLRALARAGVPIDLVTGTSIGAAVGAGVAAGRTLEAIAASIESAGRGALVPSLPPFHSMFSSGAVERELKRQFGSRVIEDLDLPLGIAAVDLTTADEHLFTSGALVPAILASMAVPGVFRPVRYQNRVFVDGALRSPVPVRGCRDLGADVVIASHMRVAPDGEERRPHMPWVQETVAGALDIMQQHIATESVAGAEIYIETTIPRSMGGLFDFSRRRWLEAAGEAAAEAALVRRSAHIPRPGRAKAA
jgi:NTE family protein